MGPDGQRYKGPHTFDTEREARDWLDLQRAQLTLGQWRSPNLGAVTLDAFAVDWLASRDDLKPKTQAGYADLLDRHITPHLGRFQLSTLTPVVVRQWYAKLGQTTGKTVRAQAYRLLHTVMAEAVRQGRADVNPCNIRGAGYVKATERQVLTPSEIETLAAQMPERWRFLIQAAAWTGLRFGEIVELRRQDVIMGTDQNGDAVATFSVSRNAATVSGRFIVGTPKTHAGCRTVTLPPHLIPALQAHLDTFAALEPDALVFPTVHGHRLTSSELSRLLKPAKDVIGCPALHFHDLRHTAATLAAQTGATTKELMARLGHSTPGAAMIYQHAAQERDELLARGLSQLAALPGNVIPIRRVA